MLQSSVAVMITAVKQILKQTSGIQLQKQPDHQFGPSYSI